MKPNQVETKHLVSIDKWGKMIQQSAEKLDLKHSKCIRRSAFFRLPSWMFVYMNKASEVCTIAVIIDKTYKHKCNCAHDSGYGLQPVPQNHAVPTCSHCGPIFFYTIGELQITVLYIP